MSHAALQILLGLSTSVLHGRSSLKAQRPGTFAGDVPLAGKTAKQRFQTHSSTRCYLRKTLLTRASRSQPAELTDSKMASLQLFAVTLTTFPVAFFSRYSHPCPRLFNSQASRLSASIATAIAKHPPPSNCHPIVTASSLKSCTLTRQHGSVR